MKAMFPAHQYDPGISRNVRVGAGRFVFSAFVLLLAALSAHSAERVLRIQTLSNRSDMISGGDALVRVDVPQALGLESVRVKLNGSDISGLFRRDEKSHSLTGLVTGLVEGNNTLIAAPAGLNRKIPAAELKIMNHSITGPVFAGPKESPFICGTTDFKLQSGGTLGPPLDADCSVKTRIDYAYRPKDGGALKPLTDLKQAPTDVAEVTTSNGVTVPYIVRIETGSIDRAIYQIAVLHNPTSEPPVDFEMKPAGWNGRLIYVFGGGCVGGWHQQGSTTGGVVDDVMLRRGYAIASSSLNVFGNNCDDVLATEAMMMVKEHVVETLGAPLFTIGWGCSGGAEQVQPIAQNYPGLLDGIVPGCSFSDGAFTIVPSITDARLLNHYFTIASASYDDKQKVALSGYVTMQTLTLLAKTLAGRIRVGEFCPSVLPMSLRYDAEANPKGTRCDLYDHVANVYGKDPNSGFARRPLDNVGVQYGLKTLNAGTISKEQFLDLNEKIGGYDVDGNVSPRRTVADLEAVRRAYATGRIVTGGGGLATTPIIDYRAYADEDPAGNSHLRYYSFVTRARLQKTNGYSDNQVMLAEDFRYGLYSTKSPLLQEALTKMDQWLTNISEDKSNDSQITKVRTGKPADLVDACWTRDPVPQKVIEKQVYGSGRCEQIYPSASFPRGVAGAPIAADVIKCQLKPIDPNDYEVRFTADEMARLKEMFPDGVCDWSKPGVDARALAGTWLSYGAGTLAVPISKPTASTR